MGGCISLFRGFILIFILTLVLHQVELSVFLPASKANKVLVRWRRSNSIFLEELFEGNLEKECYEEICKYEEAREVFEDDVRTAEFWRQYRGGFPCISQPCLNNGTCKDNIRGYSCTCNPGYEGKNCAMAENECHLERTNGCQHFCHPGQSSYVCSCAKGYKLGKDNKSCSPRDKCACGALTSENVTVPERGCQSPPTFPWQVRLTDSEGMDFCAGVLIQEDFVLTTAKCSLLHNNISVKANAGQRIEVKSTHVHMHYEEESGENDISLLALARPVQCPRSGLPVCVPERDFAEHVLIPGTEGLLSGWMLSGTDLDTTPMVLSVTGADREECGQTLNVTVTTRTGCEKGSVETGPWLEGSAVTREHKGTWFLTGILGSQPPPGPSHLLLLTTVPRYSMWLKQIMK
ncbi:vitamin K-dependent protein Z isoform X1 [Psammomys obesus]|uniref:vitamin K-dependent protein Z isoform X1 n=1 Tax=Psammomys obesus TaxID=48139 RepID=UPI002452F328|nr:vitamin K-dependent protein Z isoform X1 [Psammomys obesus]